MTHCYQLNINEREEISLGLAQGFSKNYIAISLSRSSSTICREVNRNTAKGQAYRAVKAQGRANKLRHLARKSRKVDINKIMDVAAETGTILEINAYPERLDLNDIYCRMAKDRGVQLAIETDAHSIDGLEFMNLGVDVARRGWLEEKDIINTLSLEKLLKRLKNK